MRSLARATELWSSACRLASTNVPENQTNQLLIAAGLEETKPNWQRLKRVTESKALAQGDIEKRAGKASN